MNIIINNSSMRPIYEQLVEQIKSLIIHGDIKIEEKLPSVRELAGQLRISALTVKKAYDELETEGMIITVHGKGSFVAGVNKGLLLEEHKREVELELENTINKARAIGMTTEEIIELFNIIMEV
ncbi:MAG: GntR family transcriptional regulator [Lachnospiraceae bacterium]|nr:GntR family transcriptional regulator [Lachnospiraceae bacterium]